MIAGRGLVFGLLAYLGVCGGATYGPDDDGILALRTPDPVAAREPGRHAVRLYAAGHWWWYAAHVPRTYDPARPLPLVLVLHGSGGTADQYLDGAGWGDLAEQEGFLVVAPEALALWPDQEPSVPLNPRIWNSTPHTFTTPRAAVDDLAFFDALMEDVTARWAVEPSRVYLTGHSNGGAMAFRLASARSGRYAALAVVASHCWNEPGRLERALPTLLVAGTKDPLLPLAGGLAVLPWEIRASPPLEATTRRWARALGVSPKPARVRQRKSMSILDYGRPEQAAALRVVLLEGHGHGWPGHPRSDPLVGRRAFYGPRAESMDATRLVWEYLRAQSIPADGGPARVSVAGVSR